MSKNNLNYKFEIFPTAPQRKRLNTVLRHERLQWNKAVTVRKKLKAALVSKQFEYIIDSLLSNGKSNTQSTRAAAIAKFMDGFPGIGFASAAKLYDIKNIVGNTIGNITEELLDNDVLISRISGQHAAEIEARKAAVKPGSKLPPAKVYWQLLRAINQYAGYSAKVYMDNSYESPKNMSLSSVRFAISGSAKSQKWITATAPKAGQREQGATGEPRYKKKALGFGPWQSPSDIRSLIRKTRDNTQIYVTPLKEWVNVAIHRQIPDGSNAKTISVATDSGRYFIVISAEVPAEAYAIKPLNEGWAVGINPAEDPALTASFKNLNTGERNALSFHYEFLEKSLGRLEKLQQSMALKQGPKRKLTDAEIAERLGAFEKKLAKNITDEKRTDSISKEKERLSKIMVRTENGPSKNWRKLVKRVSALYFHVSNQRLDVRHKISRFLAETADVIAIGNWEPEREIPYRTMLKKLKKEVKRGVEGAEKALKELEESKSKNGEKNSSIKRREARDRATASLRAAIKEKSVRSGAYADVTVAEPTTTYICNHCHAETGPRGKEGLKIRRWTCPECGTEHDRNINAGFNILDKMFENIKAENTEPNGGAQPPSPERGKTAARNPVQGATVKSEPIGFGFRATELVSMKGGSFVLSMSLKSLSDMGIVREPERYIADLSSKEEVCEPKKPISECRKST